MNIRPWITKLISERIVILYAIPFRRQYHLILRRNWDQTWEKILNFLIPLNIFQWKKISLAISCKILKKLDEYQKQEKTTLCKSVQWEEIFRENKKLRRGSYSLFSLSFWIWEGKLNKYETHQVLIKPAYEVHVL